MAQLFDQKKMFEDTNKASFKVDEDRIEKLKELFPSIVSDGKIDWKKLKLLLGEKVTTEDERYQFNWSGKSKAVREASIPTTKTLRPYPSEDESKNWDDTQNIYIEGDNLEVLKALQNSYNGKIKMIYIDPPYNTGNDFIYNDDFVLSTEETELQEGLKDKKGATQTIDRLAKNTKDSAKYHTNWLNMMYPRLSIARDLLTDDGVIFISIDDKEVHNLRKICDEIFGQNNFISNLAVVNNLKGRSDDEYIATSHESLLIYKKSNEFTTYGIPMPKEYIEEYNLEDDKGKYRLLGLRKRGTNSKREDRPNMFYSFYYNEEQNILSLDKIENSMEIIPSLSDGSEGCWRWGKNTSKERINELEVKYIKKRNEFDVYQKDYLLREGEIRVVKAKSFWLESKFSSDEGTRNFKELFKNKAFNSPKAVDFILQCLHQGTKNDDIILDFFSGSGTTAQAVMKLNDLDNGTRKFILVQLPEKSEEKSEAYKAGYKNICEIGKERIRRAGEKIISEIKDLDNQLKLGEETKDISNLDVGFKVFKLDSSNFNEWDTSYESLEKAIKDTASGVYATYKEDRNHLDLIYEILLKEGHQLTESVEEVKVGDSSIYKIGDGVMYVFLDEMNQAVIDKIVEMKKEAFELFNVTNPVVILNEAKLNTEIKSNAKKNFETNGITNIKTL